MLAFGRSCRDSGVVRIGLAAVAAVGALVAPVRATPPMRIAAAAGLPGFPLPGVPGAALSVIGAPQIDDAGEVVGTCRLAGPGITYSANDLALLVFDRYAHARLLARTGIPSGDG